MPADAPSSSIVRAVSLGRISWLRRMRLEIPLGHRNFSPGLKSSGECDGGLGLARFSAVFPLAGHMYANDLLWYAGMAGAACMVLLFGCLVYLFRTRPRYPPARSGPCWSHRTLGVAPSPLALAEALQHPLPATRTSTVATMTCPDYLHPHI
jgi:hypothetical protein